MTPDLRAIAHAFDIPGEFRSAVPTGSGHINDSYRVTFHAANQLSHYLLQRINHHIFTDPAALMQNIQRVTSHLAAKLAAEPDRHRHTLTLIPTRDARAWHTDPSGNHWRVYRSIEQARTLDIVESPAQAYQAAKAFGQFQHLLSDLPAPRLHDTIPNFHHTPKRFAALERAITADVANRAHRARPEIDFALRRQPITTVLLDANLPERVTHNDTKLNNVMLDDRTGEAICVIDLDTVMPGLAPYDFGDLVRTTTSPAAEDEQDLSRVTMQFQLFEALLRGYLASAASFLIPAERNHLVAAGKLITFEQGIRFLADHLAGDTYYKIHRPSQNLDRARTQFHLVSSIEQQEDAMHRLVESLAPST
jgi:Ser/Thr protein kinase RdoA (MazF antagonist)